MEGQWLPRDHRAWLSRGSWDLALLPYVVLIQPLGGGGGGGGGTRVCKCACVSVARGGGWS